MIRGAMGPELWLGWIGMLHAILGNSGGPRIWPSVGPLVRPSFVTFVDQEVLPTDAEVSTTNFIGPLFSGSQGGV